MTNLVQGAQGMGTIRQVGYFRGCKNGAKVCLPLELCWQKMQRPCAKWACMALDQSAMNGKRFLWFPEECGAGRGVGGVQVGYCQGQEVQCTLL